MNSTKPDVAATGVAGLDEILRGGLPRKRIYLLRGAPGTGKTTLALQFLLQGVRQGEAGLYVTLSETEEELRAVANSHAWNLDGIALHQLTSPEEMLEAQKQNTLFHPAEVELNETISKVMALVEAVKPKRIVFDSLSEMRLLAGESLRYRRQILALKQKLAGRNSTVLFLDDGTADEGDSQLESIAHGVISLDKSTPAYGPVRRHIEVIKLRGIDFSTGLHDFVIEQRGVNVFHRLVAADHHRRFEDELLPSGVKDLDALLGGGLLRGTSTLLIGPAGVGKSTMAAQYLSAALNRKEVVACFSFDENLALVHRRAKAMGIDLSAGAGDLAYVRQVDPAEMSPGEFAAAVRRVVEERNARVVVIDSLNGYLMAMPSENYLLLHMHELLTYLAQRGVTTILVVAQHGMVGSMQAPIDLTYLADTVVLFRFFEAEGKMRKAVSVLKKRVGKHEETIREFQVVEDGIRVGAPLSAFRGILTGVPHFVGEQKKLFSEKSGHD
jgi:circadian clock protein KaiC